MNDVYDIAIVGAGPAGYSAAIRGAQHGKRVVLIERGGLGGVCLNRGCIPTKAFVASANVLKECRRAREFGVLFDGEPRIDFTAVQERKRRILATLRKGIAQLLDGNGVALIHGVAMFRDARTLTVGGREIRAENIIVATGSEWVRIPNLVPDGNRIMNSDHVMALTALPESVLIVGGGYIGCEFASFMNHMGVAVTVVEATEGLLPIVERRIARELTRAFTKSGITVTTGTSVESTSIEGDRVVTVLANGERIETERVLVSVGRKPSSAGLGLEAAGVACGPRGAIEVNERFETNVPGIYAVGDVNGQILLAHAASEQAISCVDMICGGEGHYDGRFVPSCIFTDPEIGYVGRTTEQLTAAGVSFSTGTFPFAALGKAQVDGLTQGQVIIHADPNGKLLGVHVIGDNATGIVAEATVALKQGMSARELASIIHAHPTVAEAVPEAARDIDGCAIHKPARKRR